MRRGQEAQPHSSHTTRRHPRKEGTQRQQPPTMQEEKTSTTISLSSFPQPTGNGHNPQPQHNAHGASEPSSIHDAVKNFLPSCPQWDTEPKSTQSHAVLHTRRKGDAGCALPLPSPHGHGGRQQPPHATASMHCKRSIQIHCNVHLVRVVVCACRNTKQKSREMEAECVGCNKMYSGGAWRKQQEEDRSNS
ncbi:hypothetical protein TcCL_NonESM08807 [Trypanosoma cruzi]|nr:hypothetical protein TcCL_NonESM08807 [Trypanosoma cruzi]